jgi:hypothetical protein
LRSATGRHGIGDRLRDVSWVPSALERVVAASAGYPYFLQVCGKATWDFATRSPIDDNDAQVRLEAGRAELHVGFYKSRWERA